MLKKYLPETVHIRPGLMIAVIAFIGLLVMLIFYNVYRTFGSIRHKPEASTTTSQVKTATNADTEWFRSAAQQKRAVPLSQPVVATEPQAASAQPSTVPANKGQEELQKAMAAPLTSNQIVGQVDATNHTPAISPSAITNGSVAMSTDDQNKQSEKLAFLQSQNLSHDYILHATLEKPVSPYILKSGAIIPCILLTGINSDLPGQITAQVKSSVYDTIAGRFLLIPQGAKLTGLYDSKIVYGQRRVLVVWRYINYPDGSTLPLEGMPGVDLNGYAGFQDKVDNHYSKIFGSVVLMSLLSAGAQLSQPQQEQSPFAPPTVGQTLAQSLGTNIANTGTMITAKNINIQPTLIIRPGYEFNVQVTKDIPFTGPYTGY